MGKVYISTNITGTCFIYIYTHVHELTCRSEKSVDNATKVACCTQWLYVNNVTMVHVILFLCAPCILHDRRQLYYILGI